MEDRPIQQQVYEAAFDIRREPRGEIGPAKIDRWRQTLKFLPQGLTSLLDVGCDTGEWLDLLSRERHTKRLVGIDIARNRIAEGRSRHPHLELQVGTIAEARERFEAVTALEIIEHLPDWEKTLDAMFQVAEKVVLVTVPYKQVITRTACIHCGRITPLDGHLRSYDESTFRPRAGWQLRFGYILKRGLGERRWLRRLQYAFRPTKNWMLALYERANE